MCSQSVGAGLQAVIDEICKPLDEIADAEALRDAILLIPQLLNTTEAVQDTVEVSSNTLEAIRDFLVNTVNVSIDGIKNVADDTNSFLKNVVNGTVNGIKSAVDAIKGVVDSIKSVVDGLGGGIF